jgi:hypothetical protein
MSFFAQPTAPPQPKTANVRLISLLLAVLLVAVVVAQLFTFEKFAEVFTGMALPGSEVFAPVYGAVIVTLEVFALPFLLAMRLSVAMRVFSMIVGWLAVATWLFLSIWGASIGDSAMNSGLLGATVVLPAGWWSVSFSVALAVLAAWAAWGMWPLGQPKAKR